MALARICAGGAQQCASLPQTGVRLASVGSTRAVDPCGAGPFVGDVSVARYITSARRRDSGLHVVTIGRTFQFGRLCTALGIADARSTSSFVGRDFLDASQFAFRRRCTPRGFCALKHLASEQLALYTFGRFLGAVWFDRLAGCGRRRYVLLVDVVGHTALAVLPAFKHRHWPD